MAQQLNNLAIELLEYVRQLSVQQQNPSRSSLNETLTPPFSTWDHRDWVRAVHLWRERGASTIANLPTRSCPACANSSHQWLFNSYDDYPYHECRDCGTWFVPYQVDEAAFAEFFHDCPEAEAILQRKVAQRLAGDSPRQDCERVGTYLDELSNLLSTAQGEPSVLDLGCGVGHSLQAARARGWTAHGIEVNTTAAALARQQGNTVVSSAADLTGSRFTLLSCWETLEHVADPKSVLTECLPLLAEDGLLALTVPNLNAPTVRLLRGDCTWVFGGFHAAGHINFFHLASLTRLCETLGLSILDADTQFGNNWLEIASYQLGLHRGARDHLAGQAVCTDLPGQAQEMIRAIGPGGSLLERLTLTAPILKIVACRQGQEVRFATQAERLRERRAAAIQAEADKELATWHTVQVHEKCPPATAPSWELAASFLRKVARRVVRN